MTQELRTASAVACANIALIKYWGKRDIRLNLPAVGSISLTLDALKTHTRVTFDSNLEKDSLVINGQQASESQQERISDFLNIIREKSKSYRYADIITENNFPTGAGLASSASGFAALGMAAIHALGIVLDKKELSVLSRRGSGSAARSIYGGFVEMLIGNDPAVEGDFAVRLAPHDYWDLRLLVLITSKDEKKIGSTEAMNLTANTSPYYQDWINSSGKDLEEMRDAIKKKDFEKLGDLAEFSSMKMHALIFSSRPPIIYWNSKTLEIIEEVKQLRKNGFQVYYTIDAGPQVKIVTLADDIEAIKRHFNSFQGIEKIIESKLGEGAELTGVDI